ncbi:hypothetical protein ACFXG4_41190 [Nocardia sp. NPDC059246]|uniref:hypothetical protein n=1 Tax=unclassified Nocardia TaxID=2637762 RepID=UPI00369FC657
MTTPDHRLLAWALLSRAALTTPDLVRDLLREHDVLEAADHVTSLVRIFPTKPSLHA